MIWCLLLGVSASANGGLLSRIPKSKLSSSSPPNKKLSRFKNRGVKTPKVNTLKVKSKKTTPAATLKKIKIHQKKTVRDNKPESRSTGVSPGKIKINRNRPKESLADLDQRREYKLGELEAIATNDKPAWQRGKTSARDGVIREPRYNFTLQPDRYVTGYQDEEDWYEIYIPEGIADPVVYIDLDFYHSDGDIDLELYDDFGSRIDRSGGSSDSEYIEADVVAGNYYHIKVYYGDRGNYYSLIWSYDFDGYEVLDPYEDNDYRSSAYDLSYDEGFWLSQVAGMAVAEDYYDEDWYEIKVEAPYTILEAYISHSASSYDAPELKLYNNYGSKIYDFDPDELIELAPGTYYLKVDDTGEDDLPYDLFWETFEPEDDIFEENDSRYSAYDLSGYEGYLLTDFNNGGGVLKDEDWYEVYITDENKRLFVDLYFDDSDGDIELEVYNSSGTRVAYSHSSSDDETLDLMLPTAGRYFIRVYTTFSSDYDASPLYDLVWATERTAPWYEERTQLFHVPFIDIGISGFNKKYYSVTLKYYNFDRLEVVDFGDTDYNKISQNKYFKDSYAYIENNQVKADFEYFTYGDTAYWLYIDNEYANIYSINTLGEWR